MKAVNKIVKRKNKALNIFRVAREDLVKVINDTDVAADKSAAIVSDLEVRIGIEQTAQTDLAIEKSQMVATVENINKILGN